MSSTRQKIGIWLIAIICVFTFITNLYAESIGYVDMQRVFLNYSETKKAQADFKKKQEELKNEFEKRQKKVEKAKKRKKSEKEIKELIEKMEKELEPKQKELVALNNQLMAKIKQDILSAVNEVAKSYGVDVVFDKQAILYGGFDLTTFVLDKINKD